MIKNFINQVRNLYKFYQIPKKERNIVFFSEGKNYFNVFISYIENLEKHKKIIYITSDNNDPIYDYKFKNLKIIYCKNIFLLIILMNNISCKNLLMTMPDLNTYEIKKSRNVISYIYLFHSLNSTHMNYKNNAFDSYDKILCITQNQYDELKQRKELKNLNYKLYQSNYPKLSILEKQTVKSKKNQSITIAPSWGVGNIFEDKNFEILLVELVNSGFTIILRPHSQVPHRIYTFLNKLKNKYNKDRIIIQSNNSNFHNTFESSYLITDWSGIALEYFMVTENPVIFIDTKRKIHNKNFNEKKDKIPLEVSIRKKIGLIVDPMDVKNINYHIKELEKINYKKVINEINNKVLFLEDINEKNFTQILE